MDKVWFSMCDIIIDDLIKTSLPTEAVLNLTNILKGLLTTEYTGSATSHFNE